MPTDSAEPTAAPDAPAGVVTVQTAESGYGSWPVIVDGWVIPSDPPRFTLAEIDAAWAREHAVQGVAPKLMIAPYEAFWPLLPVEATPIPDPDPEPEPEVNLRWFQSIGRRASDGRPYIGLGVIEPNGIEQEERYHPPKTTGLYALLERYITENPDE